MWTTFSSFLSERIHENHAKGQNCSCDRWRGRIGRVIAEAFADLNATLIKGEANGVAIQADALRIAVSGFPRARNANQEEEGRHVATSCFTKSIVTSRR